MGATKVGSHSSRCVLMSSKMFGARPGKHTRAGDFTVSKGGIRRPAATRGVARRRAETSLIHSQTKKQQQEHWPGLRSAMRPLARCGPLVVVQLARCGPLLVVPLEQQDGIADGAASSTAYKMCGATRTRCLSLIHHPSPLPCNA